MKALFCKVFPVIVLGLLVAAPAAADDVGVFRLGQTVTLGSAELPAGEYLFRISGHGLVLVYDEAQTKVVAAALARKDALKIANLEMSGTLAHDWAVRTLSIGDWQYTFSPGREPVTQASLPAVTTVVAQAR